MISVLLVQLIAKGNISIHTTWDIALVRARMTYKMCFYSVMISVLLVQQIVKGNISIHTTWDIAIVGAKMTYKMCC